MQANILHPVVFNQGGEKGMYPLAFSQGGMTIVIIPPAFELENLEGT